MPQCPEHYTKISPSVKLSVKGSQREENTRVLTRGWGVREGK